MAALVHPSGHLEMCWHLYSWGKSVEVLEPARLREMVYGHQRIRCAALRGSKAHSVRTRRICSFALAIHLTEPQSAKKGNRLLTLEAARSIRSNENRKSMPRDVCDAIPLNSER